MEDNIINEILAGIDRRHFFAHYSEQSLRFSNDLQVSKFNRARLWPNALKSGVLKIL